MDKLAARCARKLAGALAMHDLGVVIEIQKRVAEAAAENGIELRDVAAVVVEIGEASCVVPRYLQNCWPAATDGTEMAGAELKIELIKAEVRCNACGRVYEYLACGRRCPDCGAPECRMVRGQETNVKEILVR